MESAECVPVLWLSEVSNALLVAERRGVVPASRNLGLIEQIAKLRIIPDAEKPIARWLFVLAYAREYGLSVYDATYLDLALRTESQLATFDHKLAQAAQLAGVAIFDQVVLR